MFVHPQSILLSHRCVTFLLFPCMWVVPPSKFLSSAVIWMPSSSQTPATNPSVCFSSASFCCPHLFIFLKWMEGFHLSLPPNVCALCQDVILLLCHPPYFFSQVHRALCDAIPLPSFPPDIEAYLCSFKVTRSLTPNLISSRHVGSPFPALWILFITF